MNSVIRTNLRFLKLYQVTEKDENQKERGSESILNAKIVDTKEINGNFVILLCRFGNG